jgi:hypothetical protein
MVAHSPESRLGRILDARAWALAGSIAAIAGLVGIFGPKEPVAPGLIGQIGLLVFYLLFVLVLPLAAVAGAVSPLWCIFRLGAPARPRIHRVVVSVLAAGIWYWFLVARFVELP